MPRTSMGSFKRCVSLLNEFDRGMIFSMKWQIGNNGGVSAVGKEIVSASPDCDVLFGDCGFPSLRFW